MARVGNGKVREVDGGPRRADADALERQYVEQVARAHAAVAEAQDRSYWLDRWGVDLNALMRRRGASQFRAALRAVRGVQRLAINGRRQLKAKLLNARAEVAAEREEAAPSPTPAPSTALQRSVPPRHLETTPVTTQLYERLAEADVETVRSRLDANETAMVDMADPVNRLRLLISLGLHHGVDAVGEKTGLSPAWPPEEVHAMSRGSIATSGSLYYADLIVDGLAGAGFELSDGMRCLDFGCSSGRVVRGMAAAYPGCEWHGCDPIESAATWARDHLPGIEFLHSPEYPPLPYDDGRFDLVFAISIWSHFAEPDAIAWLAEMRRIVRPGGTLLLTTHGYQTLAHDEHHQLRLTSQLEEIRAALYESGFWFKNEFGEGGDYGVDNSGWGTAFLTPEWLLWAAKGDWRVTAFAPGRVEGNQDLYVLERR